MRVTQNPGHAPLVAAKPSAVSPPFPLKSLLLLRQVKEFG